MEFDKYKLPYECIEIKLERMYSKLLKTNEFPRPTNNVYGYLETNEENLITSNQKPPAENVNRVNCNLGKIHHPFSIYYAIRRR